MPKVCLVEVKAFPDNDSLGGNRREAFTNVYVPDHTDMDLKAFIEDACEFMGFSLTGISSVRDIPENQIPPEAVEGYKSRGAGFGSFHTHPTK